MQKPKYLILCLAPLEINGLEESKDIRKELYQYLLPRKNVYLFSHSFADRNDLMVDKIFESFPRFLKITMIYDANGKKHRRAVTWFEKVGVAPDFVEIQKLGFKTKTPGDFEYGWRYWNTNQPYIKTHTLGTFGSYDAHDLIQNNFDKVIFENKTVILGTADEYSYLGTDSVFNLFIPRGASGYKDYPVADSLANYMNFFINGDYMKLVQNFNDLILTTIILILLIIFNIENKKKLIIFTAIIPIFILLNIATYWLTSFYVNFSKSITTLFVLQYFTIPIILFSMFKEQESKKLQEINDARIDALLTISEKVAHDIRSPLSAINLVMTKAYFDDPEFKSIFDSAVQRIDETATKILTRYRTKTGSENDLVDKIDLAEIISTIIKEKKVLNSQINFEYKINSESTVAMGLKLDLERIISNILDNAIFALKNISQPKIVISLDSQNDMLQTSISDNGSGIPEQVLKLLGTTRITTKADNDGKGNGIGLLHAKRVIEKIGGIFEITSKETVGTTIKISLPMPH